MDCEKARLEMAFAAKDMLEGDDKTSFEEHLAGCEDCRAEYDEIKWAGGLLSTVSAGAGASKDEGAASTGHRLYKWPYLAAFAAVLLVAVLVTANTLFFADIPEEDSDMPVLGKIRRVFGRSEAPRAVNKEDLPFEEWAGKDAGARHKDVGCGPEPKRSRTLDEKDASEFKKTDAVDAGAVGELRTKLKAAEAEKGYGPQMELAKAGAVAEKPGRKEAGLVIFGDYGDSPGKAHGGTDNPNDEPHDGQLTKNYGVNPFVDTDDDAQSTFAIDVDTGSFTLCRNDLKKGIIPNKDLVRVEEIVNYFDYGYAAPASGIFGAHIEGGPSPFAANRRMLAIGLKGMEIDIAERKDAVLTFVIDISGSMGRDNRLGLVKRSLRLLVDQLRPADQIGIAVYGSNGYTHMTHQYVGEAKESILASIDSLKTGGSTNAARGIEIGYEMAASVLREGCINRVILCSDGVANVGNTGADSIFETIKENVQKGIVLTSVGFGVDNYNDVLLEQLGQRGNGQYAYVDDIKEAKRIFVEGLAGTLQVIARDVKIQVEFNPDVVAEYRLVGYENRDVADVDFRNDRVDGGEIGVGHTVTAVYELKMRIDETHVAAYYASKAGAPVGWLRLRYKDADYPTEVSEEQFEISGRDFSQTNSGTSNAFRLASCAAQLAEVLRESPYAEKANLAAAAETVEGLAKFKYPEVDERLNELSQMMYIADKLVKEKAAKDKAIREE